MLNKKYLQYETYARATRSNLFTAEQSHDLKHLTAETLETVLLINNGGRGYTRGRLPSEAQYAPVYGLVAADFNGDGIKDLVLAGNQSWARIKLGRFRANHGLVLMSSNGLNYAALSQPASGLNVREDTRDLLLIRNKNKQVLLFANNDAPATGYELRELK